MMSFALGEMGLRDDDFWELTPYELHQRLKGWKRRQEADRLRSLYLAWYTAMFTRAKKLPSLERVLKPPVTRRIKGRELEERRREFEEQARRAGVKVYTGNGVMNVV
jgi:hypothetical protein